MTFVFKSALKPGAGTAYLLTLLKLKRQMLSRENCMFIFFTFCSMLILLYFFLIVVSVFLAETLLPCSMDQCSSKEIYAVD